MEQVNKLLDEWAKSPTGSAVIALAFFVLRIEIDRWQRRRERHRANKKKGRANA